MQEAALPFHRNSLTRSARYVVSTSLYLQPSMHGLATPAIIMCCRVEWSVQLLQSLHMMCPHVAADHQ